MSLALPQILSSDVAPSAWRLQRLSVRQYHQLTESGVVTEDDNVELLEGWIVSKMGKNPPLDSRVMWVHEILRTLLPVGWHVRNQCSLDTPDSVPEPDLCVVRGEILDFENHHPTRDDVALVVEVADSSLASDRIKRRVYARVGVAACWIVNLVDSQLEVFSLLEGVGVDADYSGRSVLKRGDRASLLLFNHDPIEISVTDLMK